jgi:hypothetical protein
MAVFRYLFSPSNVLSEALWHEIEDERRYGRTGREPLNLPCGVGCTTARYELVGRIDGWPLSCCDVAVNRAATLKGVLASSLVFPRIAFWFVDVRFW